jgi:hypothetical protein
MNNKFNFDDVLCTQVSLLSKKKEKKEKKKKKEKGKQINSRYDNTL